MLIRITNICIALLIPVFCQAQKIASVEVFFSKGTKGLDIPVCIDLDKITYLPDSLLVLCKVNGDTEKQIPFQIEQGNPRKLHWIAETGTNSSERHYYELTKGKAANQPRIKADVRDGALLIHMEDRNFLQYWFSTVYPPEGVDTVYKRSAFIHPLWSPHGQVLTRIQPRDHYHHYGIWNPWTHVAFEGDTIDFWNINTRKGTVRFADFVSIQNGSVYSEFDAIHDHVVFKKDGRERIALKELQSVRVYAPENDPGFFIVDFNIQLNCAGDSPVKLLEYRYAGLGWRTTEKWDNKNSMVLTSEGKSRKDADGSKARWCIVQGEIDDDYAGVVMMSFPTNYNFPEPLRIWPENQYNRGDMFANFCPTKDTDWLLEPRHNYVLRYRFLVYNNRIERDKAENAWEYFANPPEIRIISAK
ncbi:MAG TPA: PmoA family protein, partial [Bacteroidales bacterium]|jgi:hypothetical protein|nr:PmoA family protein [Bacteroidales bacterium]HOS72582.1 PmoA family protein [Bacteroidales bacterium]HQH25035.1 PmoA family protein [Bacteroidales bacterium]HQJ82441.1 PmoA family protein [Bacteroidales bacterium]